MQMNVNLKIISNEIGLLTLATEFQNVSKVSKIMGYFRDTFYRYKELKEEGELVHCMKYHAESRI